MRMRLVGPRDVATRGMSTPLNFFPLGLTAPGSFTLDFAPNF